MNKQKAINEAVYFLSYFPYRLAGIAKIDGKWELVTGKTMARFNTLASKGATVLMVKK